MNITVTIEPIRGGGFGVIIEWPTGGRLIRGCETFDEATEFIKQELDETSPSTLRSMEVMA